MKTETITAAAKAPEGNLSTRQLARSLIKTAPATEPKTEPSANGQPTSREPLAAIHGDPKAEAEDLPKTETGVETEPATAPETTEPEPAAPEPGAEPGTEAEPAEPTEPAKTELPAEVREAIEIAKTQDGGKGKADLLKRVHKLVDERDTHRNARLALEEQNKQLRSELTKQGEDRRGAKADGPSGVHPEVAKLQEQIGITDQWLSWCDKNPDGGELPNGKGTVQLTAEQVAEVRRDLANQRQELVANKVGTERSVKAEYAEAFKQHHAAAVREYTWLNKPEAPEHQEMQAILQIFPAFKQSPDYELAIGDFLSGKALREQKAKARNGAPAAARKPAPAREPTRVVTEPPGTSVRKVEGSDEVKALETQFKKTGKSADFAKWQAAKTRQMRMAA